MPVGEWVQSKQEDNKLEEGITSFFSADSLEKLMSMMYPKKVNAESHLFYDGDPADYLYYVKKGTVKITKTTDHGTKVTLYIHKAGDLFGQIDPFQQSLQTFNAEVIEDSEIGIIQKKDLETLLWQHRDLSMEFIKWMGMSHRMTQSKFRDLILYGKSGALCSTLIRLSNSYGQVCESGIKINKRLTHTELAELIGATRESVNRMLGEIRKDDAISMDNGIIIIKDLAYLRDICKCESCPAAICRI